MTDHDEDLIRAAASRVWEPIKPTIAQAQEAWQVLLEHARAHPEDADLASAKQHAEMLLDTVWNDHYNPLRKP